MTESTRHAAVARNLDADTQNGLIEAYIDQVAAR